MESSPIMTSDGVSLWGSVEGTGPPMVLCHGGPGLWDYFDGFARLLRDSFTVHRWDQRGCGRSGGSPGYGLDIALRDVQEVKSGWGVADPWVVVGHSWGAHLGLLTSLEHPESTAAVVYISGTGPPTWWRSTGSALYHAERRRRLTPAMASRLAELKGLERSRAQEVEFRRLSWITDFADITSPPDELETMSSARYPINWEVNQRLVADAERPDEGQLLSACERSAVPVLLIHGSKDPRPSQGARVLADRLPNAHFVEIEGAGHLPWVERPTVVSTVIREFLYQVL